MNFPDESQWFEDVVRRRRATPHFSDRTVPRAKIDRALRLASEAPSGYNIQPWRFLVLQDREARERLRVAAFGQEKITEAPVVIVALADKVGWRENLDEIFETKAKRQQTDIDEVDGAQARAIEFIETQHLETWLTRQVMISFTFLMLAFEVQGLNTAPMEGFDSEKVREQFKLPSSSVVVALLAVGYASKPSAHPDRLAVEQTAFDDQYGIPWLREGLDSAPAVAPAELPGLATPSTP